MSLLQTHYVRIFTFLTGFFCGCITNQSKQSSVKGQFLYRSACKNSVWTHIFNLIQTHYTRTTLFCLHLQKLFSIKDRKTLSPNTMHRVCYFHWCWRILSWPGVVWSESVSLLSCILPPLHQFCAFFLLFISFVHSSSSSLFQAFFLLFISFVHSSSSSSVSCNLLSPTASNPPYQKMANFHIVSMQSRCSLVLQTFLTNQDRPYISALEMAWNMQVSPNDNSPSTLYDQLRWQQTHICSCCDFRTFWKLCVCISRNMGVHPYSQPISILIPANTGG